MPVGGTVDHLPVCALHEPSRRLDHLHLREEISRPALDTRRVLEGGVLRVEALEARGEFRESRPGFTLILGQGVLEGISARDASQASRCFLSPGA